MIFKKKLKQKKIFNWKGFQFLHLEDIIHYEVIQYIKIKYPNTVIQSNHMQGVNLIGRNINATINLRKNKKALNGSEGLPDIIIFHKTEFYSGLCIELKTNKGRLSKPQKFIENALAKQGFNTIHIGIGENFIESIEKTKKVIDSYFSTGEISDKIFLK
jgi:hypothetical protein